MKCLIFMSVLLMVLMATAIHYQSPMPCPPAPAGDSVQVCR